MSHSCSQEAIKAVCFCCGVCCGLFRWDGDKRAAGPWAPVSCLAERLPHVPLHLLVPTPSCSEPPRDILGTHPRGSLDVVPTGLSRRSNGRGRAASLWGRPRAPLAGVTLGSDCVGSRVCALREHPAVTVVTPVPTELSQAHYRHWMGGCLLTHGGSIT